MDPEFMESIKQPPNTPVPSFNDTNSTLQKVLTEESGIEINSFAYIDELLKQHKISEKNNKDIFTTHLLKCVDCSTNEIVCSYNETQKRLNDKENAIAIANKHLRKLKLDYLHETRNIASHIATIKEFEPVKIGNVVSILGFNHVLGVVIDIHDHHVSVIFQHKNGDIEFVEKTMLSIVPNVSITSIVKDFDETFWLSLIGLKVLQLEADDKNI